jgi:hypothetical protein
MTGAMKKNRLQDKILEATRKPKGAKVSNRESMNEREIFHLA